MSSPANPETGGALLATLRAVRRRLLLQRTVWVTTRTALALGGTTVAWAALARWAGAPAWDAPLAAGGCAAVLGLAMACALSRWPPLAGVAHLLDHLGGTRDRFQTALAFTAIGDRPASPAPAMQALALRECLAFIRGKSFVALLPFRLPRELPWLVAPVAALALLQWDAGQVAAEQQAETVAAQAEVSGTVVQMETLARQAQKAAEQTGSEELRDLAERMKRGAEQLRATAQDRAAAQKAALRELSALEAMVKAMQEKGREALSPEELKALAQALDQEPATKTAARALEQGQLEEAAKQLEDAARQLAEKGDKPSDEQVAKTLREALEQLSQARQISETMRELTRMTQPSGPVGEALRQLAQMLRQMPRPGGSQNPSGGKPTPQTLQSLLAALQALKNGRGAPQQGGNPNQPGSGGGKVMVQNFSPPGGESTPLPALAGAPTGRAGSERDEGTSDSPFGNDRTESAEKGADLALGGQLGAGETLSQFLPGAADDAKSRRRYKELYETMAPAAEDAIVQENIPLGSRFFIKRYFEAIRPKE